MGFSQALVSSHIQGRVKNLRKVLNEAQNKTGCYHKYYFKCLVEVFLIHSYRLLSLVFKGSRQQNTCNVTNVVPKRFQGLITYII